MNILFDLDGTIIDSKVGVIKCIRFALSELEIEIADDIVLESYIGPPLFDTFKELCGNDLLAKKAILYFRQRYSAEGLYESRVYSGIRECLNKLQDQAHEICIVTSKPTLYALEIIKYLDLSKFFNYTYGSELDNLITAKYDLLKFIIERENLIPSDTIMIGDRNSDAIAARQHDIESIGVLWGYGSKAELINAGVSKVCGHPNEIMDYLFA